MAVLRHLLARLRALPPRRLDALLGVAVWLEVCLELILLTSLHGTTLALGFGLAATFGSGVALRRRAPALAVGLATCGLYVGTLLGPDVTDHAVLPFFIAIFVAFSVGLNAEGRRLAVAFAVGVAFSIASVIADPTQGNDVGSFIFTPTFTVAAPMLLGQLLRNRLRLNAALQDKARRDERGRAVEAEAAAQAERTRIAGELHDVVAHALSAMTVQATAARRLTTQDPGRAMHAFAAVEGTGREALTELRRLLGVLRREDEELALAPQPSLANVDGLARRATSSGLPVAVAVAGTPVPLPAGVDLTAYRVIQEALGRARDAGFAGRADVEIGYADGHVSVEVRDDGAARGRQLLGTRERVAVYGGELTSGAVDGGWRVTARLPAEGRA